MANNTYTIRVKVSDGGDVAQIEKALSGLGATVTRTRRATTEAAAAATDMGRVQNQGIIGTANSTRSFSKLAETLGGNSSGLVGAYATLAANIFAVTAAFNALRGASQVEQVFRGLEAAGVRTGQSLTSTAKALRDVTGAAINTEQALRATAQISSAGFGQDAIERLGKAARDTSFALGRNMTDSLERLSRGIVKLEPELLDELGIMTKIGESNANYALQLGKTENQLTNFEKRQGFLNAVLAEAELKFGGLSDSAGDSTAYDKLSATFSDLTNKTLNMANAFAKPLANALSGSETLLLGVAISFGATLRNQLIPGLANTSAASLAAAKELKELAANKLEAVKAARELAKAEQAQALASRTNFSYVGQNGPKVFMGLADSVRAGTASMEDQQKALTSLQRSHRANAAILANNPNFAAGTDRGDAKRADQTAIENEIRAIQELQAARTRADQFDVEGSNRVLAARNAAKVAAREALAQQASAASIGAASQLKLTESWKQLSLSVRAYASAQALATAGGIDGMGKLRIATFAASTAAKSLGVAFLAALPWIGALVTVAGLLSSAIDSMKSDRTKRIAQDFEGLSEVTDKAGKYLAEIKRANDSLAPSALRTAQAITIQSNAIAETTQKLNELVLTSQSANRDNGFIKLSNSIKELFTFDVDKIEFKGNFNQSSAGVKKVRSAFNELVFDLGSGKDETTLGAEKALEAINKLAPRTLDRVVKLRGGWDQLKNSMDSDTYVRSVQAIANEVDSEFNKAAGAVKSVQESFKALDESLARFTTSSVISTSMDEVVKNFDSVKTSIADLRNAGKGEGPAWGAVLTGIGPNITQYLDAATEKSLDLYKTQDSIAQALQKQKTDTGSLSAVEQHRLENAQRIVSFGGTLYKNIANQLEASEKLFVNSQKMERTYKGQLDLLNAHIQANQGIYAAAGAGVRARIAQEEKVRGLQAAQVKLQIDLNHAAYDRQRLRIEELKTMNTMSVFQAEQLKAELEMSKAAQERALAQRGISLAAVRAGQLTGNAYKAYAGNTAEAQQTAAMIDTYTVFMRDRIKSGEEAVKNAKELEALQRSTRDADAALVNLQNQLNVLAEQNLTIQQKRAAIREADTAYQTATLNTLNEQKKALNDIYNTNQDSAAITAGVNDNLNYQLKVIRERANLERDEVQRKAASSKATAEAAIQTARSLLSRRNLTGLEREAGNVAIKNANDQLTLAKQQEQIDLNRIDAQESLAIAQRAFFDSAKEGMDWQRTSLDYMQRQVDATRQLSDEQQKIYELRVKLDAKRRGFEVGSQGTQALEIKAANEAYRLALAESTLKKSMIDLEFALLDAQKEQLTAELQARRSTLNANTDSIRINQIDATLDRLSRVDLNAIAANSKRAVDAGVEATKLALETALAPAVTGAFGNLMSAATGYRQRQKAAAEAQGTLATARAPGTESVVRPETQQEKLARIEAANPVVKSNGDLMRKIDEWIAAIGKQLGQNTPTGGAMKGIQDAAALAVANGFRVSEMAGYGGVSRGAHRGKGHGDGRAFDMNIGTGNVEANNPAMAARMDAMAKQFRDMGFKVLWRTAGHFDHMHVEITKSAEKAAMASVKTVENVQKAAEQKLDPANIDTPDILAVGKRLPKMPAMDMGSVYANIPEILPPATAFDGVTSALQAFNDLTSQTVENLRNLGPQGEVVIGLTQGMANIGQSVISAADMFNDPKASFADKFTAVAAAAQTALTTISSVLAAGAQAKEDAIQREIDAETRRDGKSAESVAKLAALEKKKDEISRKQFNTNKKLMMAQAVIATAAGVAQALTLGPIVGPIMAGVIAAMGAAQLAIISGTSYQSTASTQAQATQPPSLTIGKRGDSVDLAKQNNNVGGELGYLRGSQGYGRNASNYSVIGSAYGGELPRGYGNTAYVVGEKGPETIVPDVPMTVRPANDNSAGAPISASISIHAIDAHGVEEVLEKQKGNLISMLRSAANANGSPFMEDVNTAVYSRPNSTGNTRL